MTQALMFLMIEHSVPRAEVYKTYLPDEQCQVVAVDSVGRARATHRAFPPVTVFLDTQLPEVSGLDFVSETRAIENPVQLIVMTAHGTSEMALEAIQERAFDFFSKPFDAARSRVALENTA
ncbi:MAG: response regulator [Polyangiaceae bacterium]|nr:response regulator [Polyangiaceae bacterium]